MDGMLIKESFYLKIGVTSARLVKINLNNVIKLGHKNSLSSTSDKLWVQITKFSQEKGAKRIRSFGCGIQLLFPRQA